MASEWEATLTAGFCSLAGVLGASDCSFPSWLKSLMTVCCCVNDCSLQNVAIATLLEVINHSQSLALVIEDKMKRYKTSGNNPFFGKLQMVTVPPIAPGILKVIAEKTDFYQVWLAGKVCGGQRASSSDLFIESCLFCLRPLNVRCRWHVWQWSHSLSEQH